MRKMPSDVAKLDRISASIDADGEGNVEVGKNLEVDGNITINSIKDSKNIDGSFDNRYSQFNQSIYVPDSDVGTSEYAWHWKHRKNEQYITHYNGFIERHNWYETYLNKPQHNGYVSCMFAIEWKSSRAYSGVSSVELPVVFNGWLLDPYKSWKGWTYSIDYYGGVVTRTTGGKTYPVTISVIDHDLIFTATGESITIPADTTIRFEGSFYQRRA